eukprot:6349-Hanusia_phi.AAC.1
MNRLEEEPLLFLCLLFDNEIHPRIKFVDEPPLRGDLAGCGPDQPFAVSASPISVQGARLVNMASSVDPTPAAVRS